MLHYIDKIFYINLKKRADRKDFMEEQLTKYGLREISERFEGIETPGFGILGCGLSHMMVLSIAKERKYKRILVLEDDFQFLLSKDELVQQITGLFESYLSFDVCMLSYNMIRSLEIPSSLYVDKVIEAQTASGYIIQEHYYDILIDTWKMSIAPLFQTQMHWIYANDQIWKSLQERDNWIYFRKRIGKQLDGYSDNGECMLNNQY